MARRNQALISYAENVIDHNKAPGLVDPNVIDQKPITGWEQEQRGWLQTSYVLNVTTKISIQPSPIAATLAGELERLLEATIRASSAAEAINSVLRPYFNGRREGAADTESRQLFLNLFTVWFNLHPFESGPRKGHSPYELAGIDLGSKDWLTVLGYPPD